MELRGFRLGSDDVVKEHRVFEEYGIIDGSYTEKYRALIRFLHEGLCKYHDETPPPKYDKPECKHFTDLHNGKFECTHTRENAPPKIERNIHLENCERCLALKLEQKIQQANCTAVEGGEIKNAQVQSSAKPVLAVFPPTHTKPEQTTNTGSIFTPNPNYGLAEFNYMKADGSYICPFYTNDNKPIFTHITECGKCRKDTPEKNNTCNELRRKLQNELNKKNELRTQSQQTINKQPERGNTQNT